MIPPCNFRHPEINPFRRLQAVSEVQRQQADTMQRTLDGLKKERTLLANATLRAEESAVRQRQVLAGHQVAQDALMETAEGLTESVREFTTLMQGLHRRMATLSSFQLAGRQPGLLAEQSREASVFSYPPAKNDALSLSRFAPVAHPQWQASLSAVHLVRRHSVHTTGDVNVARSSAAACQQIDSARSAPARHPSSQGPAIIQAR